jgi:signal peptidase I
MNTDVANTTSIADQRAPKKRAFRVPLRVGLVVIAALVLLSMQAFEIPSSAMEDTLLIGDRIFVNRAQSSSVTRWLAPWLPWGEIHRGDVVVFLSPEEENLYVVKRIVGIPGDRIRIRDGALYRNGVKQDEPYVRHKLGDFNPYRDDFPAVPPSEMYGVKNLNWTSELRQHIEGEDLVVPPNNYFGMGDNRDVSYDSRYYGFFPRANVVGRPMFVYWSFATPPDEYMKRSAADRAAFLTHIIVHFFDKTRWSRTFRVVR